MNLAFSAVVLIVLTLPGFFFWYAYRIEERANLGADSHVPVGLIARGALTACVLHALWYPIANAVCNWFGFAIDLRAVVVLMAAAYGDAQGYFDYFADAVRSLTGRPYGVFGYFVSLCAASVLFGIVTRAIVGSYGWDERLPLLRSNEWFYLLERRRGLFRHLGVNRADIYVAAVIPVGPQNFLYRGMLADYSFDSRGQLDLIVLEKPSRRLLEQDRQPNEPPALGHDPRFYRLYGPLIVKYATVTTMTVRYVSLREIPPPAGR